MGRKKKLSSSHRKAKARRDGDALNGNRRARAGDQIYFRAEKDNEPSKVKRFVPDENGELIEILN